MRRWSFAKGHGTENDFVLLLDRENVMAVGPAEVRFLCDRHAGIGADGMLRAVRAVHVPEWSGDPSLWFMDYRNADGSLAEMCGNGVRVFARYLVEEGLASGPTIPIATRAGLREATLLPDGRVRVAMGRAVIGADPVTVRTESGEEFTATVVDVGNPHAVSFLTDGLPDLALHAAPVWTPAESFPDGVNCEFVQPVGDRHIAMRVFERGSGETRSCGTGTVAAAAAFHRRSDGGELPATYRVDVLGGTVDVELGADQTFLTGPAVIVAHGSVALPDA